MDKYEAMENVANEVIEHAVSVLDIFRENDVDPKIAMLSMAYAYASTAQHFEYPKEQAVDIINTALDLKLTEFVEDSEETKGEEDGR